MNLITYTKISNIDNFGLILSFASLKKFYTFCAYLRGLLDTGHEYTLRILCFTSLSLHGLYKNNCPLVYKPFDSLFITVTTIKIFKILHPRLRTINQRDQGSS